MGPNDTYFTRINLQKWTVGISGRTPHVVGSAGLQYEFGPSDSILLRQLQNGQQVSTTLDLSNIGLVYSLAFLF